MGANRLTACGLSRIEVRLASTICSQAPGREVPGWVQPGPLAYRLDSRPPIGVGGRFRGNDGARRGRLWPWGKDVRTLPARVGRDVRQKGGWSVGRGHGVM